MSRVILAMSGGVDSSASALLLQQQGYEVVGLFMRSGVTDEACTTDSSAALPIVSGRPHKQGCCSASDAADARRVADRLDIPFHALNFHEEFGRIKEYFADEYLAGRTPNPCVMCNIWLKFGRLWDFAQQVEAEFIATGHYAQVLPRSVEQTPAGTEEITAGQQFGLFRGRDSGKDQSYVLFGIDPQLLPHVLFPVGSRTKSEIRDLARQAGLNTADKPDSQEICFIPDDDYAGFLAKYRGETDTSGEFVDTSGRVIGRHAGFERFTIGQRRGLGVTFGEPRFVVRIEPESHRVVIGRREELGRSELEADRLNWLGDPPSADRRYTAQIRYQHTPAACTAGLLGDDRLAVTFDEPQFGVAPGQAVVLYDGDRVVGGGWIR